MTSKGSNTTRINCDVEDNQQMSQNPNFVSNTHVNKLVEPKTKKAKALTSNVWNFFVKFGVDKDDKEKCKCKACGKKYTCVGKLGTSHLSRYIPRCHKIPRFHDVGDMLINSEGKLKKIKIDPKMNREILSELIIPHDLPFNIVEWRVFRKYKKYLNEDCRNISRIMAKYDVMKKYEIEKVKVETTIS